MTCVNRRRLPFVWCRREAMTVFFVCLFALASGVFGQLDLPPLNPSSSPRPGDFYSNQFNGVSTARPFTPNVDQYNGPYSTTARPDIYSSSPRYPPPDYIRGLNPDITNRGYPTGNQDINNRGFDNRNYDPNDPNNRGVDDRDFVSRNPGDREYDNRNYDPRNPTGTYGDSDRDDLNQNGFRNTYQGNRGNGYYNRDTTALRRFLAQIDAQATEECTNNVAAQWNFETDVNELTQISALEAQQRYSVFQRGLWQLINGVSKDNIPDINLWRQLRLMSIIGPAALPPDQLDRYNRLINDMLAVYNNAEICAHNEPFRCGLRLQPDLTLIMARSRDWAELQHVWTEWRRNTGLKFRDLYEQLADLTNQAAKLNNFTDASEYWTYPFESARFRLEVDEVWEQISPLYEELHAYVRRKLRDLYGPERISRSAPLPAHILGNMWSQSWTNILDVTIPYPGRNFLDVTQEMIQQGYTPVTIFQLAEEFFVSMNMSALPQTFWAGSVIEKPIERDVHCQPSAWDFCNGQDYRIKMCTQVTMKDLVTAHHELTHVQYFLQYRNQPKVYRDGANPAFHEALGEAVALSVSSPRHLQTLGLVQKSVDDLAHDTNFLFAMAMDKLAFMPFALTMDKWRWDVFSKNIRKEQYNCHWWRLREQYSGIKPPVLRSEMDFDPGSKYHIPANIPYIRYFVSTVLQFQIHRSLCRAAGQYIEGDSDKPLHKCDIYRSHEAGRILKKIMRPGSSEPWIKALFDATGETRLDGQALREYFRPLEEWLRQENLRTGEYVGWTYDGDYCKFSIETAGLQVYGGFYNGAESNFSLSSFLTLLLISMFSTVAIANRYR